MEIIACNYANNLPTSAGRHSDGIDLIKRLTWVAASWTLGRLIFLVHGGGVGGDVGNVGVD